jgi:hypothetical protein
MHFNYLAIISIRGRLFQTLTKFQSPREQEISGPAENLFTFQDETWSKESARFPPGYFSVSYLRIYLYHFHT